MDANQYHSQLLTLLPRGPLWENEAGNLSYFKKLLLAFAHALDYLDGRIQKLLLESRPLTAVETIADWEADWGLPDPCTGQLATIHERQIAVWQKMVDNGGSRPIDFINLAQRLGYTITIDEFRRDLLGNAPGPYDVFTWRVNILAADETFVRQIFRAGSRAGERLNHQSQFAIECVIMRIKPAHTTIIFNYEI